MKKFQCFNYNVPSGLNIRIFGYLSKQTLTRMHSSRMRTARSPSRQVGGGLPQCMLRYTPPGVGLETLPGVGLETPQVWVWRPPGCAHGDPPGCAPGDPPGQTPQLPPGVGLETFPQARPLKLPPECGLETCKACWDTSPLETCKACWDTTPPLLWTE